MINQGRLWERLTKLGSIGKQDSGGVTRLSFTAEERTAKSLVGSFMEEAGLSVYQDTVGNLFGRREGRRPEAPVVLIGSHVDSVYNGGNFDGPLGVLAGIEVAQTLNEQNIETECPLEVVAFTDEAGADRKSTRLNSSHANISYAVFCLKKNKAYLACWPFGVISHDSAAAYHELRRIRPPDKPHITVLHGQTCRPAGIDVHHSTALPAQD